MDKKASDRPFVVTISQTLSPTNLMNTTPFPTLETFSFSETQGDSLRPGCVGSEHEHEGGGRDITHYWD